MAPRRPIAQGVPAEEMEEPELAWHELWIPPPSAVGNALLNTITSLPSTVTSMVGELSESLPFGQRDREAGE